MNNKQKKKGKQPIPKTIKYSLWTNYIGNIFEAYCPTGCGNIINANNFEAGHVISEKNGGSATFDNLRPICNVCNKGMSIYNMKEWLAESKLPYNKDTINGKIIDKPIIKDNSITILSILQKLDNTIINSINKELFSNWFSNKSKIITDITKDDFINYLIKITKNSSKHIFKNQNKNIPFILMNSVYNKLNKNDFLFILNKTIKLYPNFKNNNIQTTKITKIDIINQLHYIFSNS